MSESSAATVKPSAYLRLNSPFSLFARMRSDGGGDRDGSFGFFIEVKSTVIASSDPLENRGTCGTCQAMLVSKIACGSEC